jgi:putative endonuclease
MREKKDLGDLGEKIAKEYLENKGYKILDKNFRYSKLGELDIIAQKGNPSSAKASAGRDIVFIEVKTRKKTGPVGFWPEDNITYDKQKKLIKLSQIYLAKKKLMDCSWQIDVLAIEVYLNGSFDIRHTENAVGDMY